MTGSFKVQLINMGTRAAAFQAKLRALHEYHVRLLHNVLPAPSGVDIANNIKYFSQTLLTVLKDVRTSPHELIRDPLEDPTRMSAYPNLEYGNLYNALTMLIDVAPCIQYGQIVFGKALLQCLSCILPFLDKDLIDNLPYLVSSTISVLPPALHQDIVNALCYYILPFTITRRSSDEQECQACQSVSSVIMMVLQYSKNPAHHCQLLECLMTLKHNVVKDILCVVAYGTAVSRSSAAKLLFYYWPAFDANLFDRKVLLSKLTNDLVPFTCQREHCPNAGNAEAAKVCYDHSISITYAPDCPPPLYLCIECANEIHREHGSLEFGDILHPMQQVSMVCENKNCRSNEKSAFSICFSTECASYNGNHPIRYCSQCHSNRHNSRRGGDHVVHRSLQPAWQMDPEMQMHMVESVVSLLREAKPLHFEPGKESILDAKKNGHAITPDNISLEERQMLGRYGIWLLVGRCTPTADTPVEVLGRILSMLFHWFHVTAYSYDAAGQIESAIEKLKVDHVCNWLKEICRIHYNVFISCLLPHPPEYARVGGHWETLASRTSHLKEGLQRLICLVPYEVITSEIWDYVMPHWMEAITNDVAEKELNELKIVLSKILDPEMSPLGFDAKTMYNFVAIRFEKTTAKVQQQALHWLQILTKLEILIPLVQLFAMFGDGVRIMKYGIQHELMREKEKEPQGKDPLLAKAPKTPCKESKADMANPPRRSSISPVVEDDSGNTSAISDDEAPTNRHTEFSTDAEHNLTCCILMLDILLKQMELQDVEQHMGIHTSVCENVSRLIKCMVTAARVGLSSHVCALKVAECAYCEASTMWHQLSTKLVEFMAPLNPVRPPDVPIEDIIEEEKSSRKSPPESDKEKSRDVSLSMAPLPIPLGPLGGFADIFKLDQFFSDDGKIIIMAGPVPVAVPQPEPHSVGGVLVHMPHVCSIMTATVETVSEQLDLASILPTDRAIARSITLSDADVGSANVSVTKASVMGENGANGSNGGENGSGSDDDEEEEDSDDFWHTSVGKFKFTLDQLPQPLQYIHQLLTEIPTIKKPEILYYVLQCLKTMALHGDALAKAAREQRGFFIWCQENLLIKNLWELCNAEHSHICQVCVPLLLHCITLPLGSDVFWRVVQEAFHDVDWRVRFTAVERVTVITRFMDSTPLRSEVGLQTALATAFCHLIASMDDINVYVAQRATLYIGTIHDTAIRSLLFCLESQFDLFIVDRPVVLQSVYQLHNSLSDRKMLGWEFFLNRFDTLFVEAQINLEKCGDISYLRDLRNSDNGSEALSAKIQKAREALSQSDTTGSMAKTLSASFGTKWPYKRTMSAPASMAPRQDSKFAVPEKEKIYSRQVSAPILKRKTSRFGLDGHIHSLGGLNDDNLIGLLSRITELEESDRETIHLLVFMLMQFMARSDQAFPSEDKPVTRTQNIVLKHLFLLLGHNQIDKTFHITPDSLRVSAVFNAFLANLPQVLDQNHLIGGLILPSVMQIILYAPNPTNTSGESYQNIVFNYSLWNLEQYPRRNWLFTLLVVLYKYSYTQPPLSGYVISAIRMIMNSLRGHFHQCRRIPTTTILDIQGVGGAARSRDVSQPSLGTDPDDKEASPPASPMFPSEGTSAASKSKGQNVAFTPKLQHAFRKYNDSSLDADETESELVAIPESDLSDSTLHGSSAPGSFDDTIHFEDILPIKMESLRTRRTLDHTEEKSNKSLKSMITTKTGDTYTTKIKGSTSESVSTTVVTTHTRHSLQEGVRMIVTPLVGPETTETAIVSPPVDVHRAVTVRNKSLENAAASTSKMFAAIATNHLKALGALQDLPTPSTSKPGSSSGSGSRSTNGNNAAPATGATAASKPIGRHKTIVECSAGTSSSSADEARREKKSQAKSLKRNDKTYGSPDSPLSKMSVMPNPRDEVDAGLLPPPKSIATLEIPTPERLLPIGTQDTVATLVERVRDGLNLPDISHLKQDSLDVSESTKDDVTASSRNNSPRRLIKQVALESPPNPNAPTSAPTTTTQSQSQPQTQQDLHTSILKNVSQDLKQPTVERHPVGPSTTSNSIKRPRQKLAPFNVDTNAIPDIRSRYAGSWPPPPFQPTEEHDEDGDEATEMPNGHTTHTPSVHIQRGSSRRVGDYTIVERCSDCGAVIEEYTDEEIGILIVILGTFIHREPAMAAPFLPEVLTITSRICLSGTHAWQGENGLPLASSAQAVALQFIRCVLHQLAPNGIFLQVFQTQMKIKIRHNHFRSIAKALQDFQDLNATSPIYMVCESLTSKKALPIDQLPVIFRNMAEYLQCVPSEAGVGLAVWQQAMQAMESLLRQVIVIMPSLNNAEYMLDLIAATLRLNCVPKTLLDPYSKIMAYCVQHTKLEYQTIYDLCTLNTRSFSKDRDKNLLCRQMIFEFVQALKFKSNIPDHNLLMIIGFVLLDAGGTLPPGALPGLPDSAPVLTTNAADCLRQYINDVIDFLADFHTLSKIKNGQTSNGLGEDTLGGVLKGAVAQYLALEMSRGNSRDNKAVSRYLPWLNNAPSSLQQGPKEFTECVGHMRLLSWLLLGSLTHMALMQRRQETQALPPPLTANVAPGQGQGASVHYQHQGVTYSQPVPQEASCHIADHIQVIFAGFAEQSKTSVLHMSSLFHAFTLCQLWTVYLEQMAHNTNSNAEGSTLGVLFEFWTKVTPCILQLVSHAKPANKDQQGANVDFQTQSTNSKLSEMVNLHFLSLLEALKETNSTVLGKLLPMWSTVLSSQTQLSDTLHVRLQNVRDYAPDYEELQTHKSETLLKWLQRLQFKMGQIELQASTATQFYSI